MITKMDIIDINTMLMKQLSAFYIITDKDKVILQNTMKNTLGRLALNFGHIKNKYYNDESGNIIFNPLNTNQWLVFLYYLSNEILRQNRERELCDKIYGLSKIYSSADLFYEVSLPDVFSCDHPQGSVIGRAKFSNYFTFAQGCTVGNNKGIYPRFEEKVAMLSNSKVLGDCSIGSNVIISANTYIKDTNIPRNSIVFGSSPNLTIKSKKEYIDEYFEDRFRIT